MGNCSKKSSYYNLVQKVLKEEYDQNYTSEFNKTFGVKKNKFIKKRKIVKYIKRDVKDFPDWKTYLLTKLDTYDNHSWKSLLFNDINNSSYPEQYLFQNKMFFYEYSILNIPRTIRKRINHEFYTDTVLFPLDGDELGRSSINNLTENYQSIKSNNTENFLDEKSEKSTHLSLRIHNNSIVSKNTKDPQYENKYNINQIKKYITIILEQLKDEKHPITGIIKKFIEYYYHELNEKSEKLSDNNCEAYKEKIIKDIQFFIEIMQVALKLFYIKSINYKFFISERDEFINLISNILFNYDHLINTKKEDKNKYPIYETLFKFFEYSNKEKAKQLEKKFESFGEITPKETGVSPKFCLDKESEEFLKEYNNNKKSEIDTKTTTRSNSKVSKITEFIKKNEKRDLILNEKKENIIEDVGDDNDDSGDEMKIDERIFRRGSFQIGFGGKLNKKLRNYNEESLSQASSLTHEEFAQVFNSYRDNTNKLKEKITEDLKCFLSVGLTKVTKDTETTKPLFCDKEEIPYQKAIEYIKTIKYYNVPLEKLTLLALISVFITESVDNYWRKEINTFPQKFFTIDADELMSIYLYIIYNMNDSSIFAELDFIQSFTTNITKQSMVGYYYTTVNGCLNFILSVDDKKALVQK